MADAQPRRCCVVPQLAQGGGTGEQLPSPVSSEKRHRFEDGKENTAAAALRHRLEQVAETALAGSLFYLSEIDVDLCDARVRDLPSLH